MKIENVTKQLSVSGQVNIEDLKVLADNGVQLIVCNRPDGEVKDQPTYAEIQTHAKELGIETALIAYTSSMSDEQRDEFAELLASDKKIHAYCRTGNRSKKIWN